MKLIILTVAALGFTLNLQAQCLETLEQAAIQAVAFEAEQEIQDVFVVRSEMKAWTEAVGNNTGSAEFAMRTDISKGDMVYLQAFAKQIGTSGKCKLTRLVKIKPSSIDPLALKAEKYRIAIGKALHYSESEEEWMPAYFHSHVTSFDENQIAEALNVASPIEVFSKEESLEFLSGYAADATDYPSQDERAKYAVLFKLLKKDFKEFRVIKVGKPDSGGLDLYILGITAEGQLVGLHTVTVET